MTPSCVVFDIDDTLYLERDYVRSGFQAVGELVAQRYAITDFAARAWESFERGQRGKIFNGVLSECGLQVSDSQVGELLSCYRAHQPDIRLLDDAQATLDSLSNRSKMAAVTDGPAASQRAKALALGLARWLDPIVVTDELGPGKGKPNTTGFLLVERATQCSGAACVYIADNPLKDFAGPRALGWRTVRVRRPGGLHADLPSGQDVEVELTSLGELPGLLAKGRSAGLHPFKH